MTAPTSGGTPSSYTVTAADATNPAHGGQTCTVAGAAGSCTVIGLTNGDTYTFTVTAANPGGTSPASPPSNPVIPRPALSIFVASLPDGTVGVAYQATLSASGGTGTYTWSVASGSLPPGLTLSGGGTISGTPTTTGTFAFIVSVSDPVTQPLSITILPASAVATAKAPSEASTPAPALVSSAPPPATSSPTLAVTGSDVDRLVTDAWAAILAGGLIVIGSTRRRLPTGPAGAKDDQPPPRRQGGRGVGHLRHRAHRRTKLDVRAEARAADGGGYRLVAAEGGVSTFGDATSMTPRAVPPSTSRRRPGGRPLHRRLLVRLERPAPFRRNDAWVIHRLGDEATTGGSGRHVQSSPP